MSNKLEGRLQIVYSGVTHVDIQVESLELETNIDGRITLTASTAAEPPVAQRPHLRVVPEQPWSDPFTYERLDGKK